MLLDLDYDQVRYRIFACKHCCINPVGVRSSSIGAQTTPLLSCQQVELADEGVVPLVCVLDLDSYMKLGFLSVFLLLFSIHIWLCAFDLRFLRGNLLQN